MLISLFSYFVDTLNCPPTGDSTREQPLITLNGSGITTNPAKNTRAVWTWLRTELANKLWLLRDVEHGCDAFIISSMAGHEIPLINEVVQIHDAAQTRVQDLRAAVQKCLTVAEGEGALDDQLVVQNPECLEILATLFTDNNISAQIHDRQIQRSAKPLQPDMRSAETLRKDLGALHCDV